MSGGITGQGTSYNLPNFAGDLFTVSPTDNKFLSAIGGLTGGEKADGKILTEWQTYDLRSAASRERKEGADPEEYSSRKRARVYNVLQIVQEAVELSYTKLAAINQMGVDENLTGEHISGNNPVVNEMNFQLEQHLKQIARDVNYSMINNEKAYDASDIDTKRKMDGILAAISSNVEDASGDDLTVKMVLDLLQDVWSAGGISEEGTATLMANAALKRKLSELFIKDYGLKYSERSRNVGGVNLQTIETDFGTLNLMMERAMPTDQIAVVSLEQCAPVFLEVPGKGYLFAEPLAKTGSADKVQIYGEISLKYGNEKAHGKIINVNVPS